MTKSGNTLDQQTFKKLSRLYILALSTIALSVVISQFLIRKHLKDQQSDSTVINIAGRQRMLSQKLTKEVMQLSLETNFQKQQDLKNTLNQTLSLWRVSHISLQKGSDSLGLPENNSIVIDNMFAVLNPVFENVNTASSAIVTNISVESEEAEYAFAKALSLIKQNEGVYLTRMDGIVNQYELEANQKVSKLKNLELFLTALTLLILLGEFAFIFWPTAKTVKSTLLELLKAEQKAKKMAYDADALSISKEKSIKELRALTQAMNDTLLFARVTSSGTVLQLGRKFSKLFGFNKFISTTNFSEVLSNREPEQLVIDNLFSTYRKTGWQGEVKATTKNGEDVWLEMSIIPFNPSGNTLELLIIATNSTRRKNAQIEIERLTTSQFEEKMNQQKLISSKIIENQENEQNRIAQDVHDGIGQMLTGLKYNLESIDVNDKEKTISKIELLKQQAADIIKGIRTATFNLTPPELSDHGIVPALTKLTQELSKLTGKSIVLFCKDNLQVRLDSLIEINIYRITQEAINNALKYAESSHIIVTITKTEQMLSIVVDDNGKGFDPSAVKNIKNGDGGMGMTFMQERIKYINGRIFVNSKLDRGTRVTLNVPL